jgi:hypothetical protein
MLRLEKRKGIFVVLFGLMFLVLMGAAAMAIDMSRIWTMRNELQTSADAAALAGAVQLTTPHDPADVTDSATVIARLNRAQYDTVHVDLVQTGIWDDDAATFDPTQPVPHNAVKVEVSHGTNKMLMGLFGIAAPRVKARAIAWANAPVTNTTCLRPWSIPYVLLMQKVNLKRVALAATQSKFTLPFGDGYNGPQNLTRPFTDLDRDVLNDYMTPAEREFSLKIGAGNGNQTGVEDPPPGSSEPGQYQAVKLPRKRSAAGTVNPDGIPPQGGAQNYRENIEGLHCYPIGIGDILEVETGNMVGPTVQGVEKESPTDQDYVCAKIVGSKNNDPEDNPTTHGNCKNDGGGYGVDVKAAFHLCASGCNGQADVAVQMLGSFTLKKVYPDGDTGQTPLWEKAQIVGEFKPILGTGPVGPGPTSIRRIILVR